MHMMLLLALLVFGFNLLLLFSIGSFSSFCTPSEGSVQFNHIVQHHTVGNDARVFDALFHFLCAPLQQGIPIRKDDPVLKVMILLRFVVASMNDRAKLDI